MSSATWRSTQVNDNKKVVAEINGNPVLPVHCKRPQPAGRGRCRRARSMPLRSHALVFLPFFEMHKSFSSLRSSLRLPLLARWRAGAGGGGSNNVVTSPFLALTDLTPPLSLLLPPAVPYSGGRTRCRPRRLSSKRLFSRQMQEGRVEGRKEMEQLWVNHPSSRFMVGSMGVAWHGQASQPPRVWSDAA